MLRLVCIISLSLTLIACGDESEAPIAELDMTLEVIAPQGTDPLLVRAHIRNVGNTRTMSRGGCWLVGFSVTDADGNVVNTINPCMLALIDCAEVMVELLPHQQHHEDLRIDGVVYEMHQDPAHAWCEEVAMVPGEYHATASFAYRADHMGHMEPSRGVTASTTFTWN